MNRPVTMTRGLDLGTFTSADRSGASQGAGQVLNSGGAPSLCNWFLSRPGLEAPPPLCLRDITIPLHSNPLK